MRPVDLAHLITPSDPQLHPDGQLIAYVLSEIDLEGDRTVRSIHLHDGRRTRRFTSGPGDSRPRWSPDGRWLAFLRTTGEEGARPQLYVMPADGGEAERRTDLPLGASDLAWSPDGRQLVVVAAAWDPAVADLDDAERRRRPRRVTRLPYRTDHDGWIHDRTDRLHLVDVAGDRPVLQLDTGPADAGAPQWAPDGATIAYLAEPADLPDTEPHNQVHELVVPGDEAWEDATATEQEQHNGDGHRTVPVVAVSHRPVVAPGMWSAAHHLPDGRIVATGLTDPFDWPGTPGLWLLEDRGEALCDPRPLTPGLDRDVTPGSPASTTVGPRVVSDGLLTVAEGRGTTGIVRLALGKAPSDQEPPVVTEVVAGARCVTGFAVSPDGATLVFTATDPGTPGELYVRRDGRERCLTDLARGFRSSVDLAPTVYVPVQRDEVELDAWAVLPDGFDDAEPGSVPVLLMIHGGPTAQYGWYFFDEFQVGADAGYLVIGANPRGSSGRGASFARAVVGAWDREDSVDILDLEAVVDAVCDRFPQADTDRLAVMGGSYGGYATARLLARSSRYRSAVVERGLLDWASFSGTSDIGAYFDRMFLGGSPIDGWERHDAASPMRTAHRITTPTLVLHSDADWRCPPEQGEQLFAALKRSGTPTELLRFPDESHELSRAGSPRHRVERFEAILEWHARSG